MEIGKSLGIAARRRPNVAAILLLFISLAERAEHIARRSLHYVGLAIGWIFLLACAWGVFIWLLPPSRLKYSSLYSVPYANVTVPDKPHDCEFMTAPIGNKNCSYKAEVIAIRTETSTTGKPIVSFDGGKTWNWDAGEFKATPSVQVSWQKIDDK
jgi:hypothetical protein